MTVLGSPLACEILFILSAIGPANGTSMFTSSLSAPVFFLVISRTITTIVVEGKEDMTNEIELKELAIYTDRSPIIRLELLAGLLSDQLSPVKGLASKVEAIRLRTNASQATRGELEQLTGMVTLAWQALEMVEAELKRLREDLKN